MTEPLPIDRLLSTLIDRLREAGTFEHAATATLAPMLALASEALAESPFARSGRIVRAMLHLRPDDSYRQLVVLEAGATALSSLDAAVPLFTGAPAPLPLFTGAPTPVPRVPSATAWRWVAEHQQALSVDVHVGRVQLEGSESGKAFADRRFGEGELAGQESRDRLLDRDVSHLLVLPLRGARGRVDGMISLEADCRQAMGRPFVWRSCAAALQLIADLAAPYLATLPLEHARPHASDAFLPVVGESMASIVDLLRVFVQQSDPILISGPTGVGKSRLARWCHESSAVRGGPFEMLDLSALPEELQLAELFGWKRGAFTGAVRDNAGILTRARRGTLFLDEVDNLSPRAQAGLLQVLEERTYRVLGDDAGPRQAEVRFILGTNASLQDAVREKRFREDLYYRINVLPVRLPALRDRPDEIARWARYMAGRHHAARVPGGKATLGDGVESVLLGQPWPGNLRQLDNILRRAYAMAIMTHAGSPPHEVILEEEHVRRALAYDGAEDKSSLLDALLAAAVAFVAEIERGGAPLDLDLADCFKGFVLGVATERLGGDRDQAFRLLGREKLLAGRNHHRVFKRELERVEALCAALGHKEQLPFARALGAEKDGERGTE
jgi:DNA-binding NtrC family response regulator